MDKQNLAISNWWWEFGWKVVWKPDSMKKFGWEVNIKSTQNKDKSRKSFGALIN